MSGFEKEEERQTQKAFGWAAFDSSGILRPFHFTRRQLGFTFNFEKYCTDFLTHDVTNCRANEENDITIKIVYCGICYSDYHMIKNDYGFSSYPMVPGYVNLLN